MWLDLGLYLFAYLLGAVPFGLIFTYLFGLGDVRKIGSGNIGTANAFRAGSKLVGVLTLFADVAKGFIAVYLAQIFIQQPEAASIAGFLAVIGHIYPIYLRFKGGKGVATYLGVLMAWSWPVALGFILVWLVVMYWWRYASVASLTASALSLYGLCLFDKTLYFWAAIPLVVLIFYAHRANLRRLRAGQELRTEIKKRK